MIPEQIVCKYLPDVELLAQLAEEATELAQAALKLRRAIDGTNWTPKTLQECKDALAEEIADVEGVLSALDFGTALLDYDRVWTVKGGKMRRWAERLEGHHAND